MQTLQPIRLNIRANIKACWRKEVIIWKPDGYCKSGMGKGVSPPQSCCSAETVFLFRKSNLPAFQSPSPDWLLLYPVAACYAPASSADLSFITRASVISPPNVALHTLFYHLPSWSPPPPPPASHLPPSALSPSTRLQVIFTRHCSHILSYHCSHLFIDFYLSSPSILSISPGF